jgi:hypothetical protein
VSLLLYALAGKELLQVALEMGLVSPVLCARVGVDPLEAAVMDSEESVRCEMVGAESVKCLSPRMEGPWTLGSPSLH